MMGLMFAQIRTMSKSFYTIWAGFENGAFAEYYQEDINEPGRYTVSWQADENHSCAHNYTETDWNTYLNVPASGRAPTPAPPSSFAADVKREPLPRHCLETFTARVDNGRVGQSLFGDPYDCRKRAWYFSNKGKPQKQW